MPSPTGRKLAWPRQWRLRRCVRGLTLPCGCLAGVYETYAGGVVAVVDVVGSSCDAPGHARNVVVSEPAGETGRF
jgi:hypothetical protein